MNLFQYMHILCEERKAFVAISTPRTVTSIFNNTLSCCKLPAYFEFLITAELLTNESCLAPFEVQVLLPFQFSAPFNYPMLYCTGLGTACNTEGITNPDRLSWTKPVLKSVE